MIAPLLAALALPAVFTFNYFIPTDWIEGIRAGMSNVCLMSELRPTKTSDIRAIPKDLAEGMQNVEPLHKKIEWFCKG